MTTRVMAGGDYDGRGWGAGGRFMWRGFVPHYFCSPCDNTGIPAVITYVKLFCMVCLVQRVLCSGGLSRISMRATISSINIKTLYLQSFYIN